MSVYDNIAIQLWGIYEEASADLPGVMRKLKEIGLNGIEPFEYPKMTSPEFGNLLSELDMQVPSIHIQFDDIRENYKNYCEYFLPRGLKYLIMPGYHIHDEKEYQWFMETFTKLARDIKAEGGELLYHNHVVEFTEFKDKDGAPYWFRMLKEQTDFNFQLDCYWATVGGYKVTDILDNHPDRVKLIHVKNGKGEHESCNIDSGIIDFKPILERAEKLNLGWSVLEYEAEPSTTYDFCRNAVSYIKGLK